MAEVAAKAQVDAAFAIWNIRAEGMSLSPNKQTPQLLRLNLCEDVRIVLDRDAPGTAGQAAAMRKLARLAAEAAEDLERRAAARSDDGQGSTT